MVENTCMSQQQVQQSGTLAQLECVPALIGQQGAHIDSKVLLIRQGGQKREAQAVVVRLAVDVSGETIVGPQVF